MPTDPDCTRTAIVEARLVAKPPRKSAAPQKTEELSARRIVTGCGRGVATKLARHAAPSRLRPQCVSSRLFSSGLNAAVPCAAAPPPAPAPVGSLLLHSPLRSHPPPPLLL